MKPATALYGVYNIKENYLPQIIGNILEVSNFLTKDKKAIYKSIRKKEVVWTKYRIEKVEAQDG